MAEKLDIDVQATTPGQALLIQRLLEFRDRLRRWGDDCDASQGAAEYPVENKIFADCHRVAAEAYTHGLRQLAALNQRTREQAMPRECRTPTGLTGCCGVYNKFLSGGRVCCAFCGRVIGHVGRKD